MSVLSQVVRSNTQTRFGQYVLEERDPRRNRALVDWILALSLDFNADSAFASKPLSLSDLSGLNLYTSVNKTVTIFTTLVENLGMLFNPLSDKYVNLLFDSANTSYAEMRAHIAQLLYTMMRNQWRPLHPSPQAFVNACEDEKGDPLRIRSVPYISF